MRKALVLLLGALLICSAAINFGSPASAQVQKGPYLDQVKFTLSQDENIALQQVKTGALDAYYWRIPPTLLSGDNSAINIYLRTAGTDTLFINPAPGKNGTFNPFQFREVRYALNFLVDRDFIANEIQGGYGNPTSDPYGIYSPEYPIVIGDVESLGFHYDPQLASNMISGALTKAGATLDNGKWNYQGKPVTITIIIRQDDPTRKAIGDDLASKLEKVGFTVQKSFADLSVANTVVYGSDPQDLKWNIYTEGFAGTSVFVRYNPVIPGQMYAPWMGRMPGGANPQFWNYDNKTLDDLTQKIYFFNFTSQQERDGLVSKAVKMGEQESVRIFLVQNTDPFVAKADVGGLVNDFGAGITSKYSMINAQAPGRNSLTVGVKQIHQSSWNPIGGLDDTYSKDIYYLIVDTATFRHPYTGSVIPMRADWNDSSVVTAGPTARLKVAADAITWDTGKQQWKQAGQDTEAKSKVTFKLKYSNWHNGIPMDKSDLLYDQYFFFEWGNDTGATDNTKDPYYTAQAGPALPYAKGIRFLAPDVVESYIDQWHYDKSEIADSAALWSVQPWEISAAEERLVLAGKLAYSRGEATAKSVEWLDPIIQTHATMIKDELQKMKNEGYIPAALKDYVSISDANKRYDASIKWITDHNNAIIGNGPFYLDNYNAEAATITVKAFRDDSYPFEVGHWSQFEHPQLAKIESVNFPGMISIGQRVNGTVEISVDGKPSSQATVDYFVSNSNGLALQGKAQPTPSPGQFEIVLPENATAKLNVGSNTLKLFANSDTAFRPDIQTKDVLATPGGAGSSSSENLNYNGQVYHITGLSSTSKVANATLNPGVSVTVTFDSPGDMQLTLPAGLISNITTIKAGGNDVTFTTLSSNSDSTTIKLTVPGGSKSVIIMGAHVVPEFPIALLSLAASLALIVLLNRFAANRKLR